MRGDASGDSPRRRRRSARTSPSTWACSRSSTLRTRASSSISAAIRSSTRLMRPTSTTMLQRPHRAGARRSARGRRSPRRDCRRGPPAPACRTASAARPPPRRDRRGPRRGRSRVLVSGRARPQRRSSGSTRPPRARWRSDRPRALKLGHLAPPRRTTHPRQQPRLAPPSPTPLLGADRPARRRDRIPLPADGLFAKLNVVAVVSAPFLPPTLEASMQQSSSRPRHLVASVGTRQRLR